MEVSVQKKIIILTAPSGAGKTTIKSKLLDVLKKELSFSVSATTRKIRGKEQEGIDYHFTNEEVFKKLIENNSFIEWEMVYPGLYYGTTVQEMNRIWGEGKVPVLDIDVKGALNVKQQFGKQVLTIFIEPPSIEVLRERLQKYQDQGGTILYSSHILSEVEKTCSDIAILSRGQLIYRGARHEAIAEFGSVETAFAKLVGGEK